MQNKQHVFIVGAKGLSQYGGYETFVDKLTEYHQFNKNIQYHVACKANGDGCMDESKLEGDYRLISGKEFIYHNARCFKIKVPNIGAAQAIIYDIKSLWQCCKYIKKKKIENSIIYILACRIGPFMPFFYKKIHTLKGKVYVNPDGHEWLRAKWNKLVRKYWKWSERLMIKYSDLVVCDSINIEKYIHKQYDFKGIRETSPRTTYIAYGAETRKSRLSDSDPKIVNWYKDKGIRGAGTFYMICGRFVPENNYETMIKEFMLSHTNRDFVIITNVNKVFLEELEERLHFSKDSRIKFVGTVYDQELLKKIREDAYGYFHGHEVGGTNPSLLEALGSTKLNLLLDVGFNREVAEDAAFYWSKESGNLSSLIDKVDSLDLETINTYGEKARNRISEAYSWDLIVNRYLDIFLKSENRKR